jgi:hypothetical protein
VLVGDHQGIPLSSAGDYGDSLRSIPRRARFLMLTFQFRMLILAFVILRGRILGR